MRWRSGRLALATAVVVVVAVAAGCEKKPTQAEPDAGNPPIVGGGGDGGGGGDTDGGVVLIEAIVDLRADTNRDGVVSLEDDSDVAGKAEWNAQRGAIFLANIDDDTGRCAFNNQKSDAELAACHDAQDTIVNGDDDLLDLAILKTVPWPQAKDDVYAQLFVNDEALTKVRLFKKSGSGFLEYPAEEPLLAPELREGLEFAIEGKDIVRDDTVWDGFVDVRLEVNYKEANGERKQKSDTVRLRIAPVLTHHHLQNSEQVFVANLGGPDSTAFQNAIQAAATAAGTPKGLHRDQWGDPWTQDYFETGWMSMPKAGGEQHVIRVNFRSADPNRSQFPPASKPLREAGRIVFQLRGKDVAAVSEHTPGRHSNPVQGQMVSLDAFGNTETIPPYEHNGESYPFGRSLRGSVSNFYTDPKFSRMMESQRVQPPVYADTSWLLVGHIDETVSFLKVNSPRGWVVLANDARLAKQMLQDEVAKGNGNVPMFVGKKVWKATDQWAPTGDAQRTISQVLANTNVMNESALAAVEVDAQVGIIKEAAGLEDAEIISIPFLHEAIDGYSVAYQPGMVNMLVIDDRTLAIADPFGPIIDGKDIFKVHVEASLEPLGYNIQWVDDWLLYHINLGEVHCATNSARAIPSNKWWESGR